MVETRECMLETLRNMCCKPTVDEDKDICFDYQDGHFVMNASDTALLTTVWFYLFFSVPTEELGIVQRVVNEANSACSTKVVYNVDMKRKCIDLHIKNEFIFSSAIFKPVIYVSTMLDECLKAGNYFVKCYDRVKREMI